MFVLLLYAANAAAAAAAVSYDISYDTRYLTQPLDHFGFIRSTNTTEQPHYQQRYLVSTEHWHRDDDGPIFFYAGNEGDVTDFAANTGWMWEQAPSFGAMVVFAEQRYYGQSVPTLTTNNNYQFLSSQQVLADYVALVKILREEYGATKASKVIAVGGSYGGSSQLGFGCSSPAPFTVLLRRQHRWRGLTRTECTTLPGTTLNAETTFVLPLKKCGRVG